MNDSGGTPIPVYWKHSPGKLAPDFHVTPAEAWQMRERGEAFPINRGRALRMRVAQAHLSPQLTRVVVRDASCRMGASVMVANAEGSRYAASLVAGWAPNRYGLPAQ